MIDWEKVNELRHEVGHDAFDEVVEIFLEEVDEVITRLQTNPDPNLYEEDLHFLKGSALNLGFTEFGRLCQEGEVASAAGRVNDVDLSRVLNSFALTRASFLNGLQEGRIAG